jgi:hypothetical protein
MRGREFVAACGSAASSSALWALAMRAFKSVIFWIVIACGAALFVIIYLYEDLGLELRVDYFNNSVAIKNIGLKPIKILDIDINNSGDCTLFNNWAGNRFSPEYGEDKQDLHKFFVYKGFRHFKGLTKLLMQYEEIVNTQMPIVLQIGDSDTWGATCSSNIARVTVTTERGSATFSFVPPY